MPQTLLISDLHLSPDTPDIEQGLYAFIERESDAESLYILGDLFEAWVGDDDDSDIAERVRQRLRALTLGGTALYLQRGNRDFMLGTAFARAVGGQLLPDRQVIDLYGMPTLLMHGDLLCTDDEQYQAFRAMVHSPEWQAEMLEKSLTERRTLAQQLRAMSVDAASNKPEDIMDVNHDAVLQALKASGAERLIHGHTHRPARHETPAGERVVLGDWGVEGWCIRAEPTQLTLESFPL